MPFPAQQGTGRMGTQCWWLHHVPWVSPPPTAVRTDSPAPAPVCLLLEEGPWAAGTLSAGECERWKSLGTHTPLGEPSTELPCPRLGHSEVGPIHWVVPNITPYLCLLPHAPGGFSWEHFPVPFLHNVSSQDFILGNPRLPMPSKPGSFKTKNSTHPTLQMRRGWLCRLTRPTY